MGDTIYIKELKKNKEKYELFKKYQKMGLITEYDEELKTKLRKLYYGGFIDALTYLYFMQTSFETIGNKVEILCRALQGTDYYLFHCLTDSIKNTPFHEYNHKHLDYDSFIQIQKGSNTWIYDLFSLLKFDKDVFFELEHPELEMTAENIEDFLAVPTSAKIEAARAFARDDNFNFYCEEFYCDYIDMVEKYLEGHPYEELLRREMDYQKEKLNYTQLKYMKDQDELHHFGRTYNILNIGQK